MVLKELEDEPHMPFVVTIDRASAKKPALYALEATFGPIYTILQQHPEGHVYTIQCRMSAERLMRFTRSK
jgi:hypothetical protein